MTEKTAKRTWPTIEFEVPTEHEEMVSWLVMQNGASGCEIIQNKEGKVLIKATFAQGSLSDGELRQFEAAMEEYGFSQSLRSLKVSQVEDQDWLERWKEGFSPFTVGEKLGICPPWRQEELNSKTESGLMTGRRVILIEPGMAFGTGLHATTQYCLQQIENQSKIEEALDVGTGSGILAIATALLNSESKISAIDNDPESIRTAKLNAELNNVSEQIQLVLGTTDSVQDKQFKHIFSNMTCEDIIALLPEYERLLKPGGMIFCAGVLTEKSSLLESRLFERGWRIAHKAQSGMWTGLTITR